MNFYLLYIIYTVAFVISSYLEVRTINIIFEQKPKMNNIITIILITGLSLSKGYPLIQIQADLNPPSTMAIKLILIALNVFGEIIVFTIIYASINLKIIYVSFIFQGIISIISNTIDFVFNTEESNINLTVISYLIFLAIMIFTQYLLVRKNLKYIIRKNIYSVNRSSYVLIMVFLYAASAFVIFMSSPKLKTVSNIMGVTVLISIPFIIFLIIRLSAVSEESKETSLLLKAQLENQVEYYEKMNNMYSEMRSFRHDYKNHLLCLRSIIQSGDTEQAIQYINSLDLPQSAYQKYNTGNVIIDALLSDKNVNAEKVNTDISFCGAIPSVGISRADLCIIFSNAIDNAIEACTKFEDEEKKVISVNADHRNGYFFISISNPYCETPNMSSGHLVTSKNDKKNHGLGVGNIIKTVEKYKGNTDITFEDNVFSLKIDLQLVPDEKNNVKQ